MKQKKRQQIRQGRRRDHSGINESIASQPEQIAPTEKKEVSEPSTLEAAVAAIIGTAAVESIKETLCVDKIVGKDQINPKNFDEMKHSSPVTTNTRKPGFFHNPITIVGLEAKKLSSHSFQVNDTVEYKIDNALLRGRIKSKGGAWFWIESGTSRPRIHISSIVGKVVGSTKEAKIEITKHAAMAGSPPIPDMSDRPMFLFSEDLTTISRCERFGPGVLTAAHVVSAIMYGDVNSKEPKIGDEFYCHWTPWKYAMSYTKAKFRILLIWHDENRKQDLAVLWPIVDRKQGCFVNFGPSVKITTTWDPNVEYPALIYGIDDSSQKQMWVGPVTGTYGKYSAHPGCSGAGIYHCRDQTLLGIHSGYDHVSGANYFTPLAPYKKSILLAYDEAALNSSSPSPN